jgi:hypothetical protein
MKPEALKLEILRPRTMVGESAALPLPSRAEYSANVVIPDSAMFFCGAGIENHVAVDIGLAQSSQASAGNLSSM